MGSIFFDQKGVGGLSSIQYIFVISSWNSRGFHNWTALANNTASSECIRTSDGWRGILGSCSSCVGSWGISGWCSISAGGGLVIGWFWSLSTGFGLVEIGWFEGFVVLIGGNVGCGLNNAGGLFCFTAYFWWFNLGWSVAALVVAASCDGIAVVGWGGWVVGFNQSILWSCWGARIFDC